MIGRSILLVLGLGCADDVNSGPYAGVAMALDVNRDGVVGSEEYESASPPVAAAFSAADLDGDGGLSRDELATLARRVDPANYDPHLVPSQVASRRHQGLSTTQAGPGAPATGPAPGSGFDGSGPPLDGGAVGDGPFVAKPAHTLKGHRVPGVAPTAGNTDATGHERELFREAVQFEAEEVLARDPSAPVPSERDLRAATEAGPTSAERGALLLTLRAEVERVGLTWPASFTP